MPNVVKGRGMVGLLRYLVGPGKAEEHIRPHLVGGSELMLAGYGTEAELSRQQATEIAAWLDTPRRVHGTVVTVPVKEVDPATGDEVVIGRKEQHVWHCSLSLPPGQAPLGDEKWGQLATEFADAMGLSEAGSGKPGCRWVAIHHGPSAGGNDHIHIAASMVREDGTVWENRYYDYDKAQKACRALEARHSLTVDVGPGRERGVKPAEAARAAAAGVELTGPQELTLRVRAAAVAANSEAEFVRRVRAEGIVIKPRWAKGGMEVVEGYKVAFPPAPGKDWFFHSGYKLGRDLSLPQLRDTWPGGTEQAGEAVGEWRAAYAGDTMAETAGRESRELVPGAERLAAQRWAAFNEHLRVLPHGDTAGWAQAARETSAALAAWRDPAAARTARTLGRAAAGGKADRGPGGAAATVLLARTGRGGAGTTALGRELDRTVELIRAHYSAVGSESAVQRLARGPGLGAVAGAGRVAAQVRSLARAAERIVDHGR